MQYSEYIRIFVTENTFKTKQTYEENNVEGSVLP